MNTAGPSRGDAYIPFDTDKIAGSSGLRGAMPDLIRRKPYNIRTELACFDWSRQNVLFHGKRCANDLREPQIVAFLNRLAVKREVAASTGNQALNAPASPSTHVLGCADPAFEKIKRFRELPFSPVLFPVVLRIKPRVVSDDRPFSER